MALLTNLSREHTDWHVSEAQYRADKLRLFELPGVRAAVRPLGDRGGWPLVVPIDQIPLRGAHNAQNVAAAVAAIAAAGFNVPPLPESLAGLEPLPHRLQTVHTGAAGVEWIDDSISTTPESTIAALEALPDRWLGLIAGGSEREQDYGRLGHALATRRAPTHLVLLPDTGSRIAAAAAAHGLRAGPHVDSGRHAGGHTARPRADRARWSRAALAGGAQFQPVRQLRGARR